MIRRDRKRYEIGIFLLSGYVPWGVHLGEDFGKALPLCPPYQGDPPEWMLSCGCVLSEAEGLLWIEEGLAADGPPDRFGRRTMIAGPNLEKWVSDAWHGLQVRSWGNAHA